MLKIFKISQAHLKEPWWNLTYWLRLQSRDFVLQK